MKKIIAALVFTLAVTHFAAFGQVAAGGEYSIERSVIAGGGDSSSNGPFSVTGTAGQGAAGTRSTRELTILTGGFWQSDLRPTAARVSVSGRVLDPMRRNIARAVISLTALDGTVRSAITNTFGYYKIDGLEAGQTYILSASSRRYRFTPIPVNVFDSITGFDLTMSVKQ
jgi:hypothetical protein